MSVVSRGFCIKLFLFSGIVFLGMSVFLVETPRAFGADCSWSGGNVGPWGGVATGCDANVGAITKNNGETLVVTNTVSGYIGGGTMTCITPNFTPSGFTCACAAGYAPDTGGICLPIPTGTLSFSPIIGTTSTTINFTFSSNNAQSCEIVEIFSGVVVRSRNAGLPVSFSGTQPEGGYQYRTTCWSGPNGTGIQGPPQTTGSLSIVGTPTASFTTFNPCVIAAGNSSCMAPVSWTSSSVVNAVMTDCSGSMLWSAPSAQPATRSGFFNIPYSSGCYQIHNALASNPVLDQRTVASSCASGTTWDGSVCKAGSVPNVGIRAKIVVAYEEQSLWKRFVSFVTGRDHPALATGAAASISTTGTANVYWDATNASNCAVSGKTVTSSQLTANQDVAGAALGVGTWPYTVTCTNSNGSASDSVNVIVSNPSGGGGGGGGGGPSCLGLPVNASYYVGMNTAVGVNTPAVFSASDTAAKCEFFCDATFTWNNIAKTCDAAAVYTITSTTGPGGSIAPSGAVSVPSGASQTFTITPNATYAISNVLVDGLSIGPSGSYTFANVTANHTIDVTFAGGGLVNGSCNAAHYACNLGTSINPSLSSGTYNWTCQGSGGGTNAPCSETPSGASCMGVHYQCISGSPSNQQFDGIKYTWNCNVESCIERVPELHICPQNPSVNIGAQQQMQAWSIAGSDLSTWTSCVAPVGMDVTSSTINWNSASPSVATVSNAGLKGTVQGVAAGSSVLSATYTYNSSFGGSDSTTVTVNAATPAALHICPSSATVVAGGAPQNLKAWYTPAGTNFVSCANTTGAVDRTINTTWTSSNPATASVGNNTGVVNGLVAGSVTITANDVANSVNATATVTITGACVPDTCNNHAAQVTNTCSGSSFTITVGCGSPDASCPGIRSCDYNWKEVAP